MATIKYDFELQFETKGKAQHPVLVAVILVTVAAGLQFSKTQSIVHGQNQRLAFYACNSIQPGILYTAKGSKTQSGDPASMNYSKATTSPSYIEVPVNLVLKSPALGNTRFFGGVGPYMAVGVGGKIKNEGKIAGISYSNERDIEFSDDDPTTLDYEEGAGFGILRRFDYGLNGIAGIEGKSLVLSVNYGLGLAKLQSGSNSNEDDSNKHRVLSFTLGFKL